MEYTPRQKAVLANNKTKMAWYAILGFEVLGIVFSIIALVYSINASATIFEASSVAGLITLGSFTLSFLIVLWILWGIWKLERWVQVVLWIFAVFALLTFNLINLVIAVIVVLAYRWILKKIDVASTPKANIPDASK
ncbi:MAG: hypothetical protein WCV86_01850 [Patescibacteria group bacterium]|jgi:hypothetical protein